MECTSMRHESEVNTKKCICTVMPYATNMPRHDNTKSCTHIMIHKNSTSVFTFRNRIIVYTSREEKIMSSTRIKHYFSTSDKKKKVIHRDKHGSNT